MTKISTIPFAEFRRFLKELGYSDKRSDKGWIFYKSRDDMFVFRLYGEADFVTEGDLRTTQRFLDLRGLLEEKDFDAFVRKASTPA
jgi:hypothetical protein